MVEPLNTKSSNEVGRSGFDLDEGEITVKTAARDLISLGVPNTLTYLLQMLADFSALYFIGRLGDARYTGVVGLGITWFNISAYSIVLGFCSTLETFIPQTFGNGQLKECGVYYYRGIVLVTVSCVPFAVVLYFGQPFFLAVGIEHDVACLAGSYARALIPNLFILVQYELLRKFMNGQRIATPTTMVTVVTTTLHPLWCYLFIDVQESYLGAAAAKTFTNLLSLVLLVAYVLYSGCCHKTLGRFELDKVLKDWKPFLALAIPSALMTCLDWWAYEIMNLMAGVVGSNELSANVALVQLNMLFFMVPVGLGTSACTFVGNSIGANRVQSAKFYIMVCSAINTGVIVIAAIFLALFREAVAMYFFQHEEVIKLFSKVVFMLILTELFDTTQGLMARILIGMRKQHQATVALVIAYYFIMIPSAYILLFVLKLGLYGLWCANCLAAMSLAGIYIFIIQRTDWNALVVEAQKSE